MKLLEAVILLCVVASAYSLKVFNQVQSGTASTPTATVHPMLMAVTLVVSFGLALIFLFMYLRSLKEGDNIEEM